MATTMKPIPVGMTATTMPSGGRIVGIGEYGSGATASFVVATEQGVWRYDASDGRLWPVPFVVPIPQ